MLRSRMMSIVTVLVVSSSLAACGSSSGGYGSAGQATTTAAPDGSGGASGGSTTISGFAFEIGDGVKAGVPFTVTNNDDTAHTFTNPDGAFDVTVPGSNTAEVTIATAGTYQVVCKIHGSMKATIVVG